MMTLREVRKSKGWSQAQLAYRANVGIQTVHRMEQGNPALRVTAEAVAQALGMKVEEVDLKIVNRVR